MSLFNPRKTKPQHFHQYSQSRSHTLHTPSRIAQQKLIFQIRARTSQLLPINTQMSIRSSQYIQCNSSCINRSVLVENVFVAWLRDTYGSWGGKEVELVRKTRAKPGPVLGPYIRCCRGRSWSWLRWVLPRKRPSTSKSLPRVWKNREIISSCQRKNYFIYFIYLTSPCNIISIRNRSQIPIKMINQSISCQKVLFFQHTWLARSEMLHPAIV